MSRLLFVLPAVDPGDAVRIDTASGSSTPADITPAGGGPAITGAVLHAGELGQLPRVLGPSDGTSTLYLKHLNYKGTVTGSPVTLTGVDLDAAPDAPGASSAAIPTDYQLLFGHWSPGSHPTVAGGSLDVPFTQSLDSGGSAVAWASSPTPERIELTPGWYVASLAAIYFADAPDDAATALYTASLILRNPGGDVTDSGGSVFEPFQNNNPYEQVGYQPGGSELSVHWPMFRVFNEGTYLVVNVGASGLTVDTTVNSAELFVGRLADPPA